MLEMKDYALTENLISQLFIPLACVRCLRCALNAVFFAVLEIPANALIGTRTSIDSILSNWNLSLCANTSGTTLLIDLGLIVSFIQIINWIIL